MTPSPAVCSRFPASAIVPVLVLSLDPSLFAVPARGAALAPEPSAGQEVKASDADLAALSWGANRFSLEVYRRLASDAGDKSLFFSPASVHIALAMTMLGANGTTEREMRRVLHLEGKDDAALLAALEERATRLATARKIPSEEGGKVVQRPAYELSVASALWGQRGFPFQKQYLDSVTSAFHAKLELLDFARNAEAAATINAFVEKETRERVRGLVSPDLLSADTRLVLTNAIYFKSAWEHPFPKGATETLPFHLAGGEAVKTPHMRVHEDFAYFEEKGLQIVELPYSRGDLSMIILLPEAADGLSRLEESLTVEELAAWRKALKGRPVIVTLPRFRVETRYELAKTLIGLGVKKAFDPAAADFTRMTSADRLFISAVIHKAFVEVNEEGTEAAAATAVVMLRASAAEPREPVPFTADHPFLFLIRHRATDTILFAGRVTDPR